MKEGRSPYRKSVRTPPILRTYPGEAMQVLHVKFREVMFYELG
jgi:hypothetical protein